MTSLVEPQITVVIPTYNRPEELRRCLAALAAQRCSRNCFEVIVADDGGALSPAGVVESFRDALDVTLLVVTHGGPAHARNRAVERARGVFLAFTDDDCRPDPDWLRRLLAALERAPAALVGGRVANALVENPFSSASQAVTDVVYAHYNSRADEARFFASNNLAIATEEFRRIGGFDERFLVLACEDRELCDRWLSAGGRMFYAPDAVVNHAHALGLRSFVRQHFTYGRGAFHFHRIRAARGSGTLREELSFHADLRNWLGGPFRGRSLREGLALAALLILWQGVNALGFLYESVVRTGYRK